MPRPRTEPAPATKPKPGARRWLLFVHQLPSNPSNLRVRTWRRLQQLGAIPLKQAVYVLPDTTGAREDFEWLKTEVKATGGDASVFTADNVDAWSDDALVEEFRRSRQDAYADLARDVEKAVKRASGGRRPRGTRAPAVRRLLDIFRERLTAIEAIDFFGSAGRDRVITLLDQLESRAFDATGFTSIGRLRSGNVVSGTTLDHASATRRRSDGLGVADSTVHRSTGTFRLCRGSASGPRRRRPVRHVWRRLQPSG